MTPPFSPLSKNFSRHRTTLSLLLAFSLSACGGGETTSPPPQTAAPPPPAARVAAAPQAQQPQRQAGRPRRGGADLPQVPVVEEIPPNTFVLGIEEPNFTIDVERLNPPSDLYAVYLAPGQAVDSSRFYIGDGNTGRTTSRPSRVRSSFQLPEGFQVVAGTEFSPEGLPWFILCEADGSRMALVPGGAYVQGVDGGPPNAGPAHTAIVDGFYMDVTEVTLARYHRFREAMRAERSSLPGEPLNSTSPESYPVLGVTWRDALRYAEWSGKALPSEAEWEKAARGEQSFPYVWGTTRPLWPRTREPGQIDPVGSFPTDRSVYGILDLAGNAREWCHDLYDPQAYAGARQRDGSPLRNWLGPARVPEMSLRVVRGSNAAWEAWHRDGMHMSQPKPDVGFRCVLRVQIPDQPSAVVEELDD